MTSTKNNEFSISVLLVVGLLGAVGLVYLFVYSMAEDGFGKNMERANQQQDSGLLARIKPVVTLADLMVAKDNSGAETQVVATKSGKDLYAGACGACHGSGVAGAPKLGESDTWKPRFEAGLDALVNSAITGKGAMPPRGGSAYSDEEMRSTVEFMLAEAGLI